MIGHWQQLIANLAVVALFISAWGHGNFIFAGHPKIWRSIAFGITMGLGALASMMLAVPIDGAIFDLRLSLIAITGFFGGFLAGAIAATFAVTYRIILGGGPVAMAVAGIIVAFIGSVLISRVTRRRVHAMISAVLLATMVASITLGVSVFAGLSTGLTALSTPIVVLNFVATIIAAFFLMRHRGLERERDMLKASFLQSPDVQYIKTPDSKFIAVNGVLARASGYDDPQDLVGKTDYDILQAESAEAIVADDRQLIVTGRPKIDFEERVLDPLGEEIYYLTSKVPLKDSDGDIVGVAGWTRDITARKRLEREVIESRNQLNYVLSEMTDGIAMFDSQGTLVYRNNQYRALFPLTSEIRRPGQHIRDILGAVLETGEQIVPEGQEQEWLDGVANSLNQESEEEIRLYDGRWLHLRTRPTAEGQALVVVSDVTKIRQAEVALKAMTEQLKLLATTDGLTGLTNRRAFDSALETEIARSRRDGTPLSLILADVDRFKAYNDIYGHQMGDEVLKTVAKCLQQSMRRPGDVAARYGGEEFVAILPGTDEDGAFFIADAFRQALKQLGTPHKGSDKGVVTASAGIATFTQRDEGVNAIELVRRADEALYKAKGAGRDRVTGWRPRSEVRPLRA